MTRNPPWTPEEIILALELYVSANKKWLPPNSDEVIALSDLLNRLPIHATDPKDKRFRNPQGVSMKLGNFMALDPDYPGEGLSRGSKLDKEIWDAFANDPDRLYKTAESIKSASVLSDVISHALSNEDEEFTEGKILTRVHKYRERNTRAVKQKKKAVLEKTGKLICEVCSFDFYEVYGDRGAGFAECHHLIPLSELGDNVTTQVKDLAIVCANCHRMLHRNPLISIEELRKEINVK